MERATKFNVQLLKEDGRMPRLKWPRQSVADGRYCQKSCDTKKAVDASAMRDMVEAIGRRGTDDASRLLRDIEMDQRALAALLPLWNATRATDGPDQRVDAMLRGADVTKYDLTTLVETCVSDSHMVEVLGDQYIGMIWRFLFDNFPDRCPRPCERPRAGTAKSWVCEKHPELHGALCPRPKMRSVPLSELTRERVRRWLLSLTDLRNRHAKTPRAVKWDTRVKHMIAIGKFHDWLKADAGLPKQFYNDDTPNITLGILKASDKTKDDRRHDAKPRERLSYEEARNVVDSLPDDVDGTIIQRARAAVGLKAVMALAMAVAAEAGALARLRRRHVSLALRQVTLHDGHTGKVVAEDGRTRPVIVIDDWAWAHFVAHYNTMRDKSPDALVFEELCAVSRTTGEYSGKLKGSVRVRLQKAIRRINAAQSSTAFRKLPLADFHDFRGTFAVWAVRTGLLTPDEARRFMGHKDHSRIMENVYMKHVTREEKDAAIRDRLLAQMKQAKKQAS